MSLACQDVSKRFGGIQALDQFDITVEADEIVGLIGPNGAGKTTLFNVITGLLEPTGGQVSFEGESLLEKRPHEICWAGIARSFQTPKPIRTVSVEENLEIARHFGHGDESTLPSIDDTLELFDLAARRGASPDALQLVEKKYLDLARALMTGPRLLLLDEIMAGLNPGEKQRMIEVIRQLHERFDLAVLVIEHDLKVIRSISDRIVVIHEGRNLAAGTPEEIFENEQVRQTYVGRT